MVIGTLAFNCLLSGQMRFHFILHISVVVMLGAVLLLSAAPAAAQISIAVSDTILGDYRPSNMLLPVYGELPASSNVRLSFRYDASRINIKNIIGGGTMKISCISPLLSTTASELIGTFELQCDSAGGGSGKLMDLSLEILAGRDSIAKITPDSVFIDGVLQQFQAKAGTIFIGDAPVKQVITEGLEQNTPNPFYLNTSFYYNIDTDTPVHFRIYSLIGQLVRDFSPFQQARGRHRFYIVTDPGEFASGAYYLTMQTNKGIYLSHILCTK